MARLGGNSPDRRHRYRLRNALNMMRASGSSRGRAPREFFSKTRHSPSDAGHFEGKKLIPPEEMIVKIKAACEARCSADFVIVAITKTARAREGLDGAINAGQAYASAGADAIFVERS